MSCPSSAHQSLPGRPNSVDNEESLLQLLESCTQPHSPEITHIFRVRCLCSSLRPFRPNDACHSLSVAIFYPSVEDYQVKNKYLHFPPVPGINLPGPSTLTSDEEQMHAAMATHLMMFLPHGIAQGFICGKIADNLLFFREDLIKRAASEGSFHSKKGKCIHVCMLLWLLHIEHPNVHSTSNVRTFWLVLIMSSLLFKGKDFVLRLRSGSGSGSGDNLEASQGQYIQKRIHYYLLVLCGESLVYFFVL